VSAERLDLALYAAPGIASALYGSARFFFPGCK
jgi:hypothetical protein